MEHKKVKTLLKPLRWVLAVVIVSYVVYYLVMHRQQLASLKQLTPMTLLLLMLLNLLNTYVYGIRLRMVVHKKSGVVIPLWPWLKFFLVSRFLGLYAGQAGNLYRATVLKTRYKVSITKYISSFVFITWLDTTLALVFAMGVVAVLSPSMTLFGINAIILLFGLLLILAVLPLVVENGLRRLHFSGKFISWLHRRLSEMTGIVVASLKDRHFMVNICAIESLSFISSALGIYVCFQGLGITINVPQAALLFVIMKLCNRLIITPGNVGVREFAYGLISEQLNIGLAQGILVSVIGRVITLLMTTALGMMCGGYETVKQIRKDNIVATDNSIENKMQL